MKSNLIALMSSIALVGCASTPDIDRVQRIPVYQEVPIELLSCTEAPILTDEEIEALETETQFIEQYLDPLIEAHQICFDSVQDVKDWNSSIRERNNNE